MGMYTAAQFEIPVKPGLRDHIKAIAKEIGFEGDWGYEVVDNPPRPSMEPTHPFFGCPHWRSIFDDQMWSFAPDGRLYALCFSYINNGRYEVEDYLNWLTPYLDFRENETDLVVGKITWETPFFGGDPTHPIRYRNGKLFFDEFVNWTTNDEYRDYGFGFELPEPTAEIEPLWEPRWDWHTEGIWDIGSIISWGSKEG